MTWTRQNAQERRLNVDGAVLVSLCGLVLAAVLGLAAPAKAGDEGWSGFANPIAEQADPWITRSHDKYLACFSEGNRGISIYVSDHLSAFGAKHVVWTAPSTGPASREVWAPELHFQDGRWYIYFAASDGHNENHRAWVLESAGDDPLGPYVLHGPLYTGDDPLMKQGNRWAIDMTLLQLGARRYAIWSGWPADPDLQYLYIAPLKDPLNIAAPRTRLCSNDDFEWEKVDGHPPGRGLNEAPEVLQHGDRTFVTYSCSGSWQCSYKLGLIELRQGGDPLNPRDWKKFPQPAFQSTPITFGVGHNSFVKSPDGAEDWLIYHAKFDRADGWRRVVYAQRFTWDSDGMPVFGQPVAPGQFLPLPSGEKFRTISGTRSFAFACEKDLDGWSYFGHHQFMSLQDGWLHLGQPEGPLVNAFRCGEKIVLEGGRWSDFSASVKVRPLEATGVAGLLFHLRAPAIGYNAQRAYFAGYAPGSHRVELGFTDGTAWHRLASAEAPQPMPPELLLGVTERSGQIQVSLQGQTLLEYLDRTYPSGSFGLRVADSHAAFSQLEIKAPPADTASAK